jgi:hypothetical protein
MIAPVTHILGLTTIQRERRLPVPGRVVVQQGQKVSASDVIAEAEYAREHMLLDVARNLGLSPEAADRLIRCNVGDRLAADAVVAESGGLSPRQIRTPRDSRVVAVGGGQVLLAAGETSFELRAGMPGQVVQVLPDLGAIIKASGALVQGVWGNGRLDSGLLFSLAGSPGEVLSAASLDVSLRGSVILAGYCRDAESLQAAAELPLRGLILASLHPGLLPLAAQMRYPIVVTDGFGAREMTPPAYKLLSTNVKREITLNAEPYNRYTGARPEAFIPLPVSEEPPPARQVEAFAPGQRVRLVRDPQVGQVAILARLLPGQTLLPNGLRAAAAEIRLENGEQMAVPLVNLEVVG